MLKETISANKENNQESLIKTLGAFPTFDLNKIMSENRKKEELKPLLETLQKPNESLSNLNFENIEESASDLTESAKLEQKQENSEEEIKPNRPNDESTKKN